VEDAVRDVMAGEGRRAPLSEGSQSALGLPVRGPHVVGARVDRRGGPGLSADRAHLSARPGGGAPAGASLPPGWLLDVPAAARSDVARPVVVLFHGAGGSARAGLDLLPGDAALIRLAAQSTGSTWDAIERGFGPDVRRLDEALAGIFATYPVGRIALAGFSDGASYALSLGLGNGDLITHVIAFSPGFVAPVAQRGRPRILVTHGLHDRVLPIDRCSRRLVPALRRSAYDVTYEEFDGGHVVPPERGRLAAAWLALG
jgi:predicted esterase